LYVQMLSNPALGGQLVFTITYFRSKYFEIKNLTSFLEFL
jgi:hypothetical protein